VVLSDAQRVAVQGLFAVILWGELAAWRVSADLALQLEPLESEDGGHVTIKPTTKPVNFHT
jgi:hypothetical protein